MIQENIQNIQNIHNIQKNDSELISLKHASQISGYTLQHLSYLCRDKKLKNARIGKKWFTSREWLENYFKELEEQYEKNGKQIQNELQTKKNSGISEKTIEISEQKIFEFEKRKIEFPLPQFSLPKFFWNKIGLGFAMAGMAFLIFFSFSANFLQIAFSQIKNDASIIYPYAKNFNAGVYSGAENFGSGLYAASRFVLDGSENVFTGAGSAFGSAIFKTSQFASNMDFQLPSFEINLPEIKLPDFKFSRLLAFKLPSINLNLREVRLPSGSLPSFSQISAFFVSGLGGAQSKIQLAAASAASIFGDMSRIFFRSIETFSLAVNKNFENGIKEAGNYFVQIIGGVKEFALKLVSPSEFSDFYSSAKKLRQAEQEFQKSEIPAASPALSESEMEAAKKELANLKQSGLKIEQNVIERIIEKEIAGLTSEEVDIRLNQLNNKLLSQITDLKNLVVTPIVVVFQLYHLQPTPQGNQNISPEIYVFFKHSAPYNSQDFFVDFFVFFHIFTLPLLHTLSVVTPLRLLSVWAVYIFPIPSKNIPHLCIAPFGLSHYSPRISPLRM